MAGSSTEDGSRPCECGCGELVSAGARFRLGHHARKAPRYVEVDTAYATRCWIWQLGILPNGYGIERAPDHGPMVYAHRRSYELHRGPIPEGLQIDHLCSERACINPDHLEPVTARENIRRGRGTKLTRAEVENIRESKETQEVLAGRYGVTQPHVSRIRAGLSWRDTG